MSEFQKLLGKTLTAIENDANKDVIRYICSDGSVAIQCHAQDCCEYVRVEEIIGDLADLVGSPILLAEEVTCHNEPIRIVGGNDDYCWTFYKMATVKGHVTIRWLGESNGYYSTKVDTNWEFTS